MLATCHRPRRRGRGVESEEVALERGRLDAVIAGLLFMAGMRRSEVSALRWADVVDATDGDGVLVTVRRSKTNQEGEVNDVRFVKDGVARALRTLRASTSPEPGDLVVPLSAQMVGLRFTAAARAAGVESRVTAHSGRVGLASELTSRGASTTDVMLAGNWKTSRMVAHYSAGGIFAIRGSTGVARPPSQRTVSDALRQLGRFDVEGRPITVHGFRATFRVWQMERAPGFSEAAEIALAHEESNSTKKAYARSELDAQRAELMQQWADYVLPHGLGDG